MSAENDVKLLCKTILHFDEEGLKKFNYSREDLFKSWTGSFVDSMKKNANNMFSDKQSAQIANAMMKTLQKVVIDTRATEEESKVRIIVNGLDFAKEFDNKNIKLDVFPGATQEEIVASITKTMVDKFSKMQLSKTIVFVADCEYDEESKFWIPKDMQAFFNELSASAMGNNQ